MFFIFSDKVEASGEPQGDEVEEEGNIPKIHTVEEVGVEKGEVTEKIKRSNKYIKREVRQKFIHSKGARVWTLKPSKRTHMK